MKAQVFSIDSLVAFSIFFIIMGMIAYIWVQTSLIPTFEIQQRANEVADFIVTDKMADGNILNCSKLFDLTLQDYEDLRSELNIGPYDFWIEIEGMEPDICPDVRPELDIMLVLDVSGSMSGEKIRNLTLAAKTFVDQLNESYDQAGMVTYATDANVDFELLNMTSSNKTTIKGPTCTAPLCNEICHEGINQLCCVYTPSSWLCSWNPRVTSCSECGYTPIGMYTNIGDGILYAITELNKGRSFPPVFKIQTLLSDGNPNKPSASTAVAYALDAARQACLNDNRIYTISLGADANRTLMQEIARKTYGKEYYAPNSTMLQAIFLNISREISVTDNYGKIAPNSVKEISTITRLVRSEDKILKVNIRIFEFIEGETKVCE